MAGIIPVAGSQPGALRVTKRRRHRETIMTQEQAVRRNARAIPAMSQVGTREGEPAAAAEETCFDLAASVLRRRHQSHNVRARNTKTGDDNTRPVRYANAQHDEPLQDEGADCVLHADRIRNRGRDRGLRRANSRSDIRESVAEVEIRAPATREVSGQGPLPMAGHVEQSGPRVAVLGLGLVLPSVTEGRVQSRRAALIPRA